MNNTLYLFLDDIRDPIHAYGYTHYTPFITKKWDVVRNYNQFVDYIHKNGLPLFISFDHDLADDQYSIGSFWDDPEKMKEKTGYDCAKFLIEYCIDKSLILPDYYVHSMNPVGKRNIIELLKNYEKFIK